jgi:hypothetical protein
LWAHPMPFHEKSTIFRQHTFDSTNHKYHLVLMMCKILLPLVFTISTNLVNFKCFLGLWLKQPYKHCKRFLIWETKVGLKGLYHKNCLMNHTIHTTNKWNILMLNLNYHFWFEALEGTNPINTKKHTNFETMSSCLSPFVMINKVKLLAPYLENICYTFDNKDILH